MEQSTNMSRKNAEYYLILLKTVLCTDLDANYTSIVKEAIMSDDKKPNNLVEDFVTEVEKLTLSSFPKKESAKLLRDIANKIIKEPQQYNIELSKEYQSAIDKLNCYVKDPDVAKSSSGLILQDVVKMLVSSTSKPCNANSNFPYINQHVSTTENAQSKSPEKPSRSLLTIKKTEQQPEKNMVVNENLVSTNCDKPKFISVNPNDIMSIDKNFENVKKEISNAESSVKDSIKLQVNTLQGDIKNSVVTINEVSKQIKTITDSIKEKVVSIDRNLSEIKVSVMSKIDLMNSTVNKALRDQVDDFKNKLLPIESGLKKILINSEEFEVIPKKIENIELKLDSIVKTIENVENKLNMRPTDIPSDVKAIDDLSDYMAKGLKSLTEISRFYVESQKDIEDAKEIKLNISFIKKTEFEKGAEKGRADATYELIQSIYKSFPSKFLEIQSSFAQYIETKYSAEDMIEITNDTIDSIAPFIDGEVKCGIFKITEACIILKNENQTILQKTKICFS
jgi:hypothetical protein